MNKRATITAAALIGTAGIGIGAAQMAMADPSTSPSTSASASSSSSSSSSTSSSDANKPGRGHGRGMGLPGVSSADLAEKLGLSESTVKSAIETVAEANRDSATKPDEDATQAEREAAREAREKTLITALAKELGVDEAKVTAAVDALQAEQKAEHLDALTTKLDAAVKAGTLTQAEADAVVKAYKVGVISGGGGPRG